jgi:hypothetical protein
MLRKTWIIIICMQYIVSEARWGPASACREHHVGASAANRSDRDHSGTSSSHVWLAMTRRGFLLLVAIALVCMVACGGLVRADAPASASASDSSIPESPVTVQNERHEKMAAILSRGPVANGQTKRVAIIVTGMVSFRGHAAACHTQRE